MGPCTDDPVATSLQRGPLVFCRARVLCCAVRLAPGIGAVGCAAPVTPACPPIATFMLPPRLAVPLGSMLAEIEALFGPRNHDYTLLGVEFSGNMPDLWFPGDRGDIVIRLQELAIMDEKRARFQLAHEAVHLLDPVVGDQVTVLEEGLATFYQLQYIRREDATYGTGDRKYDAAAALAGELMARCPEAVKRLRAAGQRVSAISAELLAAACPALGRDGADALASRFEGWNVKGLPTGHGATPGG
jgi:hypothetical protein